VVYSGHTTAVFKVVAAVIYGQFPMKTKNHSKNDQTSNLQTDPQQKRSVLWIGVLLFISGWIFLLGVIVGRGTAPALFDYSKIENEITTLAKTFTDSRKAQNDKETDILTTQVELEYPEELKKKTDTAVRMQIPALENPVRPAETPKSVPALENPARPPETPKPAPQEPSQATPPPPAKSDIQTAGRPETIEHVPDAIKPGPEVKIKSMYEIKTSQPRETAPERTPAAAPERAPAAIPKPQPPPPAASDSKVAAAQPVTVQLSSLLDKKSADELIVSLRSKGISASKIPKMVAGKGVWYMVVIGKYASSTEAEAMLNRLRLENVDASLVKQ
jgi:septal ring-binding cell division protein DamX